jgi:ATP-dependent helicase HrpB
VDIELRLHALRDTAPAGFDDRALRRIRQTGRHLLSRLGAVDTPDPESSAGSLLALAFPDRVARSRDAHSGRYVLSNGRGAVLPRDDPLVGSRFLVVAHLDATHADGRIFLAAAIGLDEIRDVLGGHIRREERVRFDASSESVTAHEAEHLDAVILTERQLPRPSQEAIRRLLLAEIRRRGLDALPFGDDARALRDRVRCAREWQPDAGWPDWSDAGLLAALEDWLSPWLEGVNRLDSLRRLDYAAMLRSALEWKQRKNLERLAPTHLVVPSGHRRRLLYSPGEPPVLAVKLQELFGLAETPAVCDGRVPVMLHLLSPAGRPIQVTRDLANFWRNTYAEVRKELKGRYPRHPWPDDPWTAPATAGVTKRKPKR